jgi:molybdopterin/thiamine biosynthesis adenylyltransferase
MAFSEEEIERYARHIVLSDVGGAGQQKLKSSRVLVIGAGGLGAPAIQYLAAAGVGTLGIVDDDVVSLSNLQRQVIHDTASIGTPKVASAKEMVGRLNPNVTVEAHQVRLTAGNADALVQRYDIALDCSDNFATRYAVSDACFRQGRPLVVGAVGQFDGSLTTLKPYAAGADGEPNPTYRCLFPDPPPEGLLPTCAVAGILGALTGVVGAMQALEAIKEIVGIGEGLVGRLLLYDARGARFETIAYAWNPKNPLNGRNVAAGPVPLRRS